MRAIVAFEKRHVQCHSFIGNLLRARRIAS
jgi:hypothetical protein